VVLDLRRERELEGRAGAGEWHSCTLDLPSALFQVDFVVMDRNSKAVDNNSGKVGGRGQQAGGKGTGPAASSASAAAGAARSVADWLGAAAAARPET
jgi:hypothetical protein